MKTKSKNTAAAGAAAMDFWIITGMLELTGRQERLLALISAWEGMTAPGYIRKALLGALEYSIDDARDRAGGSKPDKRAKLFLRARRRVMPGKGGGR